MKPMLAHRFADYSSRITYPVFIQPKLNGVRMIYQMGFCQSRDEILYRHSVVKHLINELETLVAPEIILDGELYVHGWSLQQINSAAGVNRKAPSPRTASIQYHVFDVIDSSQQHLPFSARASLLHSLEERIQARGCTSIRTVPTQLCTQPEAELLYPLYRSEGYEGIMYRSVNAPYGFLENCGNKENRWSCLLKRKEWMDEWCEVQGFCLTTGEKGEPGFQMTCKLGSAVFTVGSGLSHMEMEEYFRTGPPSRVKVKYEMLSDKGVPLKPTIIETEE